MGNATDTHCTHINVSSKMDLRIKDVPGWPKKNPRNSPAPASYFGTEGNTRKEPLGKAQMAAYWG